MMSNWVVALRRRLSPAMLRAGLLLVAALLGVAACDSLPYTGVPGAGTSDVGEHGRSG